MATRPRGGGDRPDAMGTILSAPYGPSGRHSLWYAAANSSAAADRAPSSAFVGAAYGPRGFRAARSGRAPKRPQSMTTTTAPVGRTRGESNTRTADSDWTAAVPMSRSGSPRTPPCRCGPVSRMRSTRTSASISTSAWPRGNWISRTAVETGSPQPTPIPAASSASQHEPVFSLSAP